MSERSQIQQAVFDGVMAHYAMDEEDTDDQTDAAALVADIMQRVDALLAEGSTQPTRDELADAIVDDVKAAVFTAKGVREAALDAIDVLVARGWVGVSDTPNEAQ